ncbi:MAG: TM2 domain-containing protein [Candidatus Pacebacteria bacterium]|nr:TM2 domain-containing protein [Candidatus Paceibacterota bacterium]
MAKRKNLYLALILAILLGFFGIHKFYLGKIKSGVLYLLFSWTFVPAILTIFDVIKLIFQDKEKFDQKYNGAA